MPRNFGFTKTPPRPSADLGRMAQAWGETNDQRSRAARRDRAYRATAIIITTIIAGILLAMIAQAAWAQAVSEAARAPSVMRF